MRPPFPRPDHVFASMGNYVFQTRALVDALHEDAADPASSHDFGKDILPRMTMRRQAIYAYDFQTNRIPGEPANQPIYWRDVGTIDAYWEANMDLRAVKPSLNLYNRQWPLRTGSFPDPPAKFAFDDDGRRGEALDTVVSGGCILSGGRVKGSVLSRGVRVHTGALVEDSVLMDNVDIGRHAKFAGQFWIRMYASRLVKPSVTIWTRPPARLHRDSQRYCRRGGRAFAR